MNRMFFRAAGMRSFLLPLMAVLMLGAVTASCSKDEALLDVVPLDATMSGWCA